MLIVEVGFKLDNSFDYYDKRLKDNGLINDFNVTTHDIYYSNRDLDNLSENEMKCACIRLRSCNDSDFKIQNNLITDLDINSIKKNSLERFEETIEKYGFKKVFDTLKKRSSLF